MTKNKLRKAVSSVLGAWTNWSVYNSTFIDDLENKFEGRETSKSVDNAEELDRGTNEETETACNDVKEEVIPCGKDTAVSTTPRGTWTSAVSVDAQETIDNIDEEDIEGEGDDDLDGEVVYDEEIDDVDGEELDDVDGDVLDGIDGDVLVSIDGDLLNDIDGDALGEED